MGRKKNKNDEFFINSLQLQSNIVLNLLTAKKIDLNALIRLVFVLINQGRLQEAFLQAGCLSQALPENWRSEGVFRQSPRKSKGEKKLSAFS